LPEGELKKKIIAKAEEWKKIDEAQGKAYDQEQQLGEACFQVLKELTQEQIDRLKKSGGEKRREIERLEKNS